MNRVTTFTFALCALMLTGTLNAQQSESEKVEIRRNRIKGITTTITLYRSNGEELSTRHKFVRRFDEQGNLVQQDGYGDGSAPLTSSKYKWDDHNKLIESMYDGKRETASYTYDTKGRVLEAKKFNSGGRVTAHYVYVLNDEGNPVEVRRYDGNGRQDRKYVNKYNSSGHVIEHSEMNPDGSLVSKTQYSVNARGYRSEELTSELDPPRTVRILYTYDDMGLLIEVVTSVSGHAPTRRTLRRNKDGLVDEELDYDGENKLSKRTTSVYEFFR